MSLHMQVLPCERPPPSVDDVLLPQISAALSSQSCCYADMSELAAAHRLHHVQPVSIENFLSEHMKVGHMTVCWVRLCPGLCCREVVYAARLI